MDCGKKILIVDDSKSFCDFMVDMIGDGFVINIASNGNEAIEQFNKYQPDIVFLDVILPDIEGYEVCATLRYNNINKPIQIILMSANYDTYKLEKILAAGADDFIKKPFDDLELMLRIKAAQIRLREQQKLIEEREFFKNAVRNEECLTEKLLNQHVDLKESIALLEEKRLNLEFENKKLVSKSTYDKLTNLLNRQSLDARIKHEVKMAREFNHNVSCLMIDLDNFKLINDEYGHLIGDKVLSYFGKILKSCLRREDIAGRYGGDEFFIILPKSKLDIADSVSARITKDLSVCQFTTDIIKLTISASIGKSQLIKTDSITSWIARADKDMYKQKKQKRETANSK